MTLPFSQRSQRWSTAEALLSLFSRVEPSHAVYRPKPSVLIIIFLLSVALSGSDVSSIGAKIKAGPALQKLMKAIENSTSRDQRMRLCNEALALRQLKPAEEGIVHGLLGSLYFEKAEEEKDRNTITHNLTESIRHYTSAIAMNGDGYYMNYWNRGYSYELMGDQDEKAIQEYSKVIQLKPEFVGGYLYRARVLAHHGYTSKALSDVRKAFKLEPGNADVQRAMKQLGAN
jgi:tetratricopeptide (TPR) repeat protein